MIDAIASTRLSFSDDSARNVGDDWRAFDFAVITISLSPRPSHSFV